MSESDNLKQLSKLIEDLTTSGSPSLDEKKVKKLKHVCKQSDNYINTAYHLLISQLQKKHAEIRYSCVQIVDQLFLRSHLFRSLLLDNFKEFLDLSIGYGPSCDLPPPKIAASKLKKLSLSLMKVWKDKYGDAYKKVYLGLDYLKSFKKIDLNKIDSSISIQDELIRQQREHQKKIIGDKILLCSSQMKVKQCEVELILKQLQNCIALLIPRLDEFGIDCPSDDGENSLQNKPQDIFSLVENHSSSCFSHSSDSAQEQDLNPIVICPVDNSSGILQPEAHSPSFIYPHDSSNIVNSQANLDILSISRSHGYNSGYFSIPVTIGSTGIVENQDNSDIISNLIELKNNLVDNFLPDIEEWFKTFHDNNCSDNLVQSSKEMLENVRLSIKKVDDLNIIRSRTSQINEDNDSSDGEFEDVPDKEGYESDIPVNLKEKTQSANIIKTTNYLAKVKYDDWNLKNLIHHDGGLEDDPTSMHTNIKKISLDLNYNHNSVAPSCSKDDKRFAVAPIVPFGPDLHIWGEEMTTPLIVRNNTDTHRFWRADEKDAEVDKVALEIMQTRVIKYSGKFEPIDHTCGHPMPNGSFCPRKDKEKCPFHGKIVPRNTCGVPLDAAERKKYFKNLTIQAEKNHKWHGNDSQDVTKNKKGKFKNKGGKNNKLTSLNSINNHSRKRLEKIVFNKSSINRVTSSMNDCDKKRYNDKFGNQFSYAL